MKINTKILLMLGSSILLASLITHYLTMRHYESDREEYISGLASLNEAHTFEIPLSEIKILNTLMESVENNDLNDFYRKSCLFMKAKYDRILAQSKSNSLNENSKSILHIVNNSIKDYESRSLCQHEN